MLPRGGRHKVVLDFSYPERKKEGGGGAPAFSCLGRKAKDRKGKVGNALFLIFLQKGGGGGKKKVRLGEALRQGRDEISGKEGGKIALPVEKERGGRKNSQ